MTENTGSEHHDRGRDTRARLRELSLQLFAEQGYEKTSLREIAEHLGVTKAALYYYFKSKEDIVRSLVEDYVADLDELIAWGKAQPRTAATRAEIVRRYLGVVAGGAELFRERIDALIDLLTGPSATLRDQVRAASALMSVSFGCMRYQNQVSSQEEL